MTIQMPIYRYAQDAGSIGDADDCWSVYKRYDDTDEEAISLVQTERLAEILVNALESELIK